MRRSALWLVAFMMVGACSGEKSTVEGAASAAPKKVAAKAQVASCDTIKVDSMCREWGQENVEAAGLDSLKSTCGDTGFATTACPADKRVGTCATLEGTKVFYSIGGYPPDAQKAQKSCAEGVPAGTWKAGG